VLDASDDIKLLMCRTKIRISIENMEKS